jgi:hypothetical protein
MKGRQKRGEKHQVHPCCWPTRERRRAALRQRKRSPLGGAAQGSENVPRTCCGEGRQLMGEGGTANPDRWDTPMT